MQSWVKYLLVGLGGALSYQVCLMIIGQFPIIFMLSIGYGGDDTPEKILSKIIDSRSEANEEHEE